MVWGGAGHLLLKDRVPSQAAALEEHGAAVGSKGVWQIIERMAGEAIDRRERRSRKTNFGGIDIGGATLENCGDDFTVRARRNAACQACIEVEGDARSREKSPRSRIGVHFHQAGSLEFRIGVVDRVKQLAIARHVR
jgi:hypothetical protein